MSSFENVNKYAHICYSNCSQQPQKEEMSKEKEIDEKGFEKEASLSYI